VLSAEGCCSGAYSPSRVHLLVDSTFCSPMTLACCPTSFYVALTPCMLAGVQVRCYFFLWTGVRCKPAVLAFLGSQTEC
jgi:hypothetical protein